MNNSASAIDRRLALMQLSDSFFPSGSFTLSHGLEFLVHSGQIQSAADLQTFLNLLLHNKIGTADLVALVHAYRASRVQDLEEVRRADLKLFAQTLIKESREAQRKSGRALLMVACATWEDAQLNWLQTAAETGYIHCLHPVIFAVVSRAACLPESDAIFAFLHNFLTGLVSAAIRLGVIGHLKAQLILKEAASEIDQAAQQAIHLSLDDMSSCTPAIDLAQMSHKRLTQRLFSN